MTQIFERNAHAHAHTLACRVSGALMTFIKTPIKTVACGHLWRACWQFPPQTNYAHVKVPSRLPPRLSCPQIRSPALSSHPPPLLGFNEKRGPKGHMQLQQSVGADVPLLTSFLCPEAIAHICDPEVPLELRALFECTLGPTPSGPA